MEPLCISHRGCPDGTCSAAIFKMKFPNGKVIFRHYDDDDLPENEYNGRSVYITDFSFPPEKLKAILSGATDLTILDHHHSAKPGIVEFARSLKPLDSGSVEIEQDDDNGYKSWMKTEDDKIVEVDFDMNKSGALITWDHLDRKSVV